MGLWTTSLKSRSFYDNGRAEGFSMSVVVFVGGEISPRLTKLPQRNFSVLSIQFCILSTLGNKKEWSCPRKYEEPDRSYLLFRLSK